MLPNGLPLPDPSDVLQALGQLALAASEAEAHAAQGLYYLLTDTPGDEAGAARISGEFRSFNSLYRLLAISLRCETPLIEMLEVARSDAQKRGPNGDPCLVAVLAEVASSLGKSEYLARYASRNPQATAVIYLSRVKALYDKRNECLHALGIEVVSNESHLYKRAKDGTKAVISAQFLMEPCAEFRHYPGISLASAIEAVSLELSMASLSLVVLPITVRWFRARGTALDFAPLVDHYVAVAVAPLDQEISTLMETKKTLEAEREAHIAANPTKSN